MVVVSLFFVKETFKELINFFSKCPNSSARISIRAHRKSSNLDSSISPPGKIGSTIGFKSPYIADIRGQGLWVGLEMDPVRIEARHVCELLQKEGVLSKETHQTTIRLAPPLVITKKELDWAIGKIKKVLLTAVK